MKQKIVSLGKLRNNTLLYKLEERSLTYDVVYYITNSTLEIVRLAIQKTF